MEAVIPDVIGLIFEALSVPDQRTLALVCRRFRDIDTRRRFKSGIVFGPLATDPCVQLISRVISLGLATPKVVFDGSAITDDFTEQLSRLAESHRFQEIKFIACRNLKTPTLRFPGLERLTLANCPIYSFRDFDCPQLQTLVLTTYMRKAWTDYVEKCSDPTRQAQLQALALEGYKPIIIVNTVNRKAWEIDLPAKLDNFTVADLKKRIERVHGASVEDIRLIAIGRSLIDEKLLTDYNIPETAPIYMALRILNRTPAS